MEISTDLYLGPNYIQLINVEDLSIYVNSIMMTVFYMEGTASDVEIILIDADNDVEMDSTFYKWDSVNHQIKIESITDSIYVGDLNLEIRIRLKDKVMDPGADKYYPQKCSLTLHVSSIVTPVAELNHAHQVHGSIATASVYSTGGEPYHAIDGFVTKCCTGDGVCKFDWEGY